MKKFFVLLCVPFVGIAHATTVNIDWLMDGSTYAQTTCETGGNFTVPTPTPTKYGYHFVGWQQNDAIGSWSQSGIPTPTDHIEPTFRQFGNTVLRALGSGDNFVADTYDPTTRKITRRIGVRVLNGRENWIMATKDYIRYHACDAYWSYDYALSQDVFKSVGLSNQLVAASTIIWSGPGNSNAFTWNGKQLHINIANNLLGITDYTQETTSTATSKLKTWLADQYAAGTPVTIYYPLATPVEENYNAQ